MYFPCKGYVRIYTVLLILFFTSFALLPFFSTVHAAPPHPSSSQEVADKVDKSAKEEQRVKNAGDNSLNDRETSASPLSKEDDKTLVIPETSGDSLPSSIPEPMGLLKQYWIFGVVALVIFIVFIVLLIKLMGGKGKAKCIKCSKKVMPGQEICDSCASTRDIIFDMETGVEPAPAMTRTSKPPVIREAHSSSPEVRKKTRPSGRVIATITVRKGPSPGYKFSIYESQLQISLGRDPECDFVVEDEEDKELSPRHAVISVADGNVFTIYDMSTTAGVMVNGEPIKQFNLKSGDVIRLSKIELTFARL